MDKLTASYHNVYVKPVSVNWVFLVFNG